MSKKSLNLDYAEKLFKEKLVDADQLPMSFVYDNKAYKIGQPDEIGRRCDDGHAERIGRDIPLQA